MRIKRVKIYQFDELSDKAKERAREWYREGAFDDAWYEATIEDAKTCLRLAGFTIKDIFFSGFSSQGDGAMFTGTWAAADTESPDAMREHAPEDEELHAIALDMYKLATLDGDASATIEHRGHYYHEHTAAFSSHFGERNALMTEMERSLVDTARRAMRWVYAQLEREWDYLISDEQVDEVIRANKYEFTETGKRES